MAAFRENRGYLVADSSDGRAFTAANHRRSEPLRIPPYDGIRSGYLLLGMHAISVPVTSISDNDGVSTRTRRAPPPHAYDNQPASWQVICPSNRDTVHILNDCGGDGAAALPLHPEELGIALTVAAAAAGTTNPWR